MLNIGLFLEYLGNDRVGSAPATEAYNPVANASASLLPLAEGSDLFNFRRRRFLARRGKQCVSLIYSIARRPESVEQQLEDASTYYVHNVTEVRVFQSNHAPVWHHSERVHCALLSVA